MIPIALQSGLGSSLGAGVRRVYFLPDLGGTLIEGVDAGEERRRSSMSSSIADKLRSLL
jgi:hypothetical protein